MLKLPIKLIINIFQYLKMLFCKHKMKSVENSNYYFHFKCEKCGKEEGIGNFNFK